MGRKYRRKQMRLAAVKAMKEEFQRNAETRQCGDCQACCELIGVKELGKPYLARCTHQCATGCAIYANRPTGCREWSCLWKGQVMPDHWRPDRSGMMLNVGKLSDGRNAIIAFEIRPSAWVSIPEDMRQSIIQNSEHGLPVAIIEYGFRQKTEFEVDSVYEAFAECDESMALVHDDDYPRLYFVPNKQTLEEHLRLTE